jgi:F-type H+-transporting ATPase subunit delta
MSGSVIAGRYARALVALGDEHDRLDQYGEELARLVAALAVEARLGLLLESPSLAKEKKTALVAGLAEYLQLSGTLRNFLGLLISRHRLGQLAAIAAAYRDQADAARGLRRAQVQSAVPLDDASRETLRHLLAGQGAAQVILEEQVVPELLGGLRVQLGDRVFDGSVRGRLRRLAGTIHQG